MVEADLGPRQRRIFELMVKKRAESPDGRVLVSDLAAAFSLFPEDMVGQIMMLEARGHVEVPPTSFPIRCRPTFEALARFAEAHAPPAGDRDPMASGPPLP